MSGTIEKLAKEYLIDKSDSSLVQVKLRDILDKIESKEKGYTSNSADNLINDLIEILAK
ncbi:hypothetical protein [Geminocystis sp. GBBB08]|uniref:hypothetical protein n=1 Tax=Geminocystis sp. GBBB08 TaxID=2604140 RepID=UPI0027E2AEA4|nr:hypothetical protein [Geminocystis sp. GBBB08]